MRAQRRGRGEGTIIYRPEKKLWAGVITTGYTPTGQRRRRWVYAKTKGDLLERVHALRQEAKTGTLAEPNRVTLAAFLDRWLESAELRPSTRALYQGAIRKHIAPRLGGVALPRLTPLQIQEALAGMERMAASPAVRALVFRILRRALRDARAWRLIAVHPCDGVPRPRYAPPPIVPFTPAELGRFFAAARTDRLHALYVLLGTAGLREGEALGLHWSDVDLQNGTATITRQLTEVRGHLALTDPKTPKARRQVPLSALAVEALKEHRKRQLAAGYYRGDGLVFSDASGGPLRRSNLRRRSYYPLLEKAQLPRRTLHSLRHGVATALLGEGVPVQVVSAILGHSRPSITLNVYAAYLPNMGKEAAARLDRLLADATP